MDTVFLPMMTDAPACNLPAPGDPPSEPWIAQLTGADGKTYVVPFSSAAAQALVQLFLRAEEPADPRAPVPVPRPADVKLP